jgi:hypothetical protein
MEPTLFGIGKSEWELYNSFSNWLSAIGTIAAVAVSLHLARKSGRPRISLSAGHRLVLTPGSKDKPKEVLVFRVVNTGDRNVRVTNIGWRIGLRNTRQAIQMFDQMQSSAMPVELAHGQEASWVIPLDFGDDPWMKSFARKMLHPNPKWSCFTLRAEAHTSLGDVYRSKPEASLLRRIREEVEAVSR